MKKIGLIATIASVGILSASSSAYAAGFAIKETSAALVGQAFAGQDAYVGDLTTLFNNPASITYLNKHEVAVSLAYIAPYTKFKKTSVQLPSGTNISGGNGGNGGQSVLVPAAYGLWNINEKLKFGLGITVPYGLTTKYDSDSVLRYAAIKSTLETLNINPVLAFKVNEKFSLAVGLAFQYANVELTKKIRTLAADRDSKATGKAWGGGFNLGALYEPWKGTRFGVAYRSSINHNLEGDLEVTGLPTQKVSADLKTPDTLSFSAAHDWNEKWTTYATAMWTRWNYFNNLTILDRDTGGLVTTERQGWKNTWFYALGFTYKFNPNWMGRFGVAWDQSPVVTEHRTPKLPDADRTWVSVGLDYKMTDALCTRLTYSHIFVQDGKINNTFAHPTNSLLNVNMVGKFQSHVDIVGLQFNWKF